jgi:ATP-dependent Clp protease ATP-binding subunit ClpB
MDLTSTKNMFQVFRQTMDVKDCYKYMQGLSLDFYKLKDWIDDHKELLENTKTKKFVQYLNYVKMPEPKFNGYNPDFFSENNEIRKSQQAQLTQIAKYKSNITENTDIWLLLAISSIEEFFGNTDFAFQFRQLTPSDNNTSIFNKGIDSSNSSLQNYLIDKRLLLKKYASVSQPEGRNEELRKMLETLLCQQSNNVLLAGLPGTGKSSAIDKLALYINSNSARGFFNQMPLLQLDYVSLISDCNSKNEAEKKLIEIFRQIANSNIILIIEDLHYLCDKNQGLPGAFMILKQFLKNANIRVIGSCSLASLKKTFNADESFISNFNVIEIPEPDDELLRNILKNRASVLQNKSGIKILHAAIEEAIKLAKKYFKETALPLSAIQLIEKSIAGISLNSDASYKEYLTNVGEAYKNQISKAEMESQPDSKPFANYQMVMVNKLNQTIGHLTGHLLFENDFNDSNLAADYFRQFDQNFNKYFDSLHITELSPLHVAATCASLTGIPAGKISQNEHEKLSNLAVNIKQRVKGQDHAIELIVRKLKTWRMNLSSTKTVGSFFLLGPTGTGKTELTKALAANLFDDANAFIRFDMSEFKEEHSAALLIGAPPGYVGYEEGGLLVNKIRQKPYAVVLFDEIEKAHHTVFDLFLQIMDEGKLHDKLGNVGDFSNALIIFTSNIASDLIQDALKARRIETLTQAELTGMIAEYARITHYIIKPEFLGRLSAIVPFATISSVLEQILDLNINTFRKKLFLEHGITLEINATFAHYLLNNNLEFEKYGARKIIQTVQTQLIEPVAEFLFNNKNNISKSVKIDYNQNEDKVTINFIET